MEEYYFLFALAIVWMIFAVVQDFKTREVANWLNFSLIGFALAYRAFYSSFTGEWMFLGFGFLGFLMFFILAHVFYYTKVFAGGDAKLLMGIGVVLPFESFSDLGFIGFGFILALLFVGAIYSLVYSVFLVRNSGKKFGKEFRGNLARYKELFAVSLALAVLLFFLVSLEFLIVLTVLLLLIPILYSYVLALESCCMIKLVSPGKLIEGDWLERDVKVGRHVIKRSVHGLSWKEIEMLKKAKKKVLIKEGVPFTPAFLIAFLIMVYAFLVLRALPSSFSSFL